MKPKEYFLDALDKAQFDFSPASSSPAGELTQLRDNCG